MLHICAENGLDMAVNAIIETPTGQQCVSVKTMDGGNLPIHLAAMSGHKKIVEKLTDLSQPFLEGLTSTEAILEDGKMRMKDWEIRNGT